MTKTITITITEEVKKERKPLYAAILVSCRGHIIVEVSTSEKRLIEYMRENYKDRLWSIEKIKNV